jgi:nicotinate-nucleotide adenylyltransferase
MRKRVILFGGSFDPIHNGHLLLALAAVKQLNACECWLMPAFDAPLKDRTLTPFHHRVNMIKAAIEGYDSLYINEIEATLPTPNYTVDTLRTLTTLYPTNEFILLIGADQSADFSRWKDPQAILSMVEVAVYPRKGYDLSDQFTKIDAPVIDVSSTDIRNGLSTDTPAKVCRYMMSKNLYTEQIVARQISKKRMDHVLRVTELSRQLANRYGIDADRAVLAGLFHDAVKQWPQTRLLHWMRLYRPELLFLPEAIWHAFVAADVLKYNYHIRDNEVLQAIAHHVEGNSSGILAKILYVADKIEPGRNYDTGMLIQSAFYDIHKTVRIVKAMQAQYLGKETTNDVN